MAEEKDTNKNALLMEMNLIKIYVTHHYVFTWEICCVAMVGIGDEEACQMVPEYITLTFSDNMNLTFQNHWEKGK